VLIILATESILVIPSVIPSSSHAVQCLTLSLFLLLFFLRLKNIKIMNQRTNKINCLLLPCLTFCTYILIWLENFQGFLFVQDRLNLSYSRVFYLTLVSAGLAVYGASFKLSKIFYKKLIFIMPVYLFLGALFVYTRNYYLFRILIQDDHVVEYLQFFLLLGTAYASFIIAKYWQQKERILAILFFLAGLVCFFVAGEEISWGQRLLGINTPEYIAETNIQDEITLHNYGSIFGYVYRGYMLIGLIGSTAWFFFKKLKHKLSNRLKLILSNLIPEWYLSLYFAPAFFYNWDRFYLRPRTGEALWEEPMELLLMSGISIFFGIKYLRIRKISFISHLINND
jgi:hypothetical protein